MDLSMLQGHGVIAFRQGDIIPIREGAIDDGGAGGGDLLRNIGIAGTAPGGKTKIDEVEGMRLLHGLAISLSWLAISACNLAGDGAFGGGLLITHPKRSNIIWMNDLLIFSIGSGDDTIVDGSGSRLEVLPAILKIIIKSLFTVACQEGIN